MLAHGLVDLVLKAHLDIHDVQALIPEIEGARGVITTYAAFDKSNIPMSEVAKENFISCECCHPTSA